MDVSDIISKSRSFADDIDKLRCEWESRSHWHVRKEFLLRNWDDFKDKDRLICLSQAWFNSRFFGNSYPQKVMELIQDMEEGMEPMLVMLKKAEQQVIGVSDTQPEQVKNVHDTSKLPRTFYAMKFVRQKTDSNCTDNENKIDGIPAETEKTCVKNIIVDSTSSDTNENGQRDGIVKRPSSDDTLESQPKRTKTSSNVDDELQSVKDVKADIPLKRPLSFLNVHHENIVLTKDSLAKLKTLVLIRRDGQSAISVIMASTAFSKVPNEFVYEEYFEKDQQECSCALHINGVLVAKAFAGSKKTAKLAAAEYALQLLEKNCEVILMSDTPGDLDAALSRDQISRPNENQKKIGDSNVGNQLLRKMGWKGEGGLGKSGTGIQAPVTVTESCNRAGLGRDSESGLISFQNAHHVIRDYAASASTDELTFTPELTNPERARIHTMCRRYGLKSKSYNKGDVRYLVVSRKVSAMDLVDQLKASGGTKGNLQLLTPPNKNQSPSAFND